MASDAAPNYGDRVGHAAERAERRRPHDHPDDAEDDLARRPRRRRRRACAASSARNEIAAAVRIAEHEDAQDLVLDERLQTKLVGSRSSVMKRDEPGCRRRPRRSTPWRLAAPSRRLRRRSRCRAAIEVADEQAERERDDRHREEVDERAQREPAGAREVAERRDADHDGDEDHRAGDGLDELDERVGEPLAPSRPASGATSPNDDAGGDRDEHPEPQLGVEPAARTIVRGRGGG